jgi:hypothetical protein
MASVFSQFAAREQSTVQVFDDFASTSDKTKAIGIVHEVLDIAHAMVSPFTYVVKSMADGAGNAIDTGTREISKSIGAVIETRVGRGVEVAVTVLVVLLVVSLVGSFVAAAARKHCRALASDQIEVHEKAALNATINNMSNSRNNLIADRCALVAQTECNETECDECIDMLSNTHFLRELLYAAHTTGGVPRRNAVRKLFDAHKDAGLNTFDKVYELVRCKDGVSALRDRLDAA